ncbi:RNase H domain-containing protein [Trichonephila clavipes]|nr:RNase H domain-containing protein [Trichonephila clavipes]
MVRNEQITLVCGLVMEDNMCGYRLDNCGNIFTAEAIFFYRALQLIDPKTSHKYCIYTDSMSVLEALDNYNDRCQPAVCDIIDITSRLHDKGCDIEFCWIPSNWVLNTTSKRTLRLGRQQETCS